MKQLLLVLICQALCLRASAQSVTPLPLQPGFLNYNDALGTVALDTVARPGTAQIPCQVAYLGAYVLYISGRGEVSVSSVVRDRSASTLVFSPTNVFGLNEVSRCSSVHGDKIVFVSITDGYIQAKRYSVVELSLANKAYTRHYRSRTPLCATYSVDGTHVLMETLGHQQTVRSAY